MISGITSAGQHHAPISAGMDTSMEQIETQSAFFSCSWAAALCPSPKAEGSRASRCSDIADSPRKAQPSRPTAGTHSCP